ncbi:MAG: hypothetical protein LLG05_07025 [Porphyromonadaceae bacterium]|nr:hypothetical protein [Porphyromonadaceae bacterium]
MTPIFHGKIEGSLLVWDNPSNVREYLIKLEGKRFDATIRKERSQRSSNQNNYYFGVVCKVLGDYFGYEPDEMHEALKLKFLQIGPCDVPTVKSTTKLNTAEFEEYLERIRRWAATEYSVQIPLPGESE